MKPFIRLACLALCAGLLLAASACSPQDSSQASTVSESSVESEATPTPEPTEAPTPEPSTPTPAPTPSPEPESSPAAGDFEAAFADNPIDAQLEEDLSPEAFSTLQAEQEAWEQGREASVQSLRTQNSDDPLAAARAIAEFYRARGQELCKAIYDATGQLPSFPEIDAGPQG